VLGLPTVARATKYHEPPLRCEQWAALADRVEVVDGEVLVGSAG